ncbi:hypothetical protein N657DRAFT_158233 [Parathielavia appendiculata]|uniref:Uncharacterized protein n=1 Tax=Parathielavia appendiculata TaxID=2587402 RepID=A0AAN6TTS7_9PEZI|nr:hypothetical protein N657DRAFT_158233 [Parathielavia appendiculata]
MTSSSYHCLFMMQLDRGKWKAEVIRWLSSTLLMHNNISACREPQDPGSYMLRGIWQADKPDLDVNRYCSFSRQYPQCRTMPRPCRYSRFHRLGTELQSGENGNRQDAGGRKQERLAVLREICFTLLPLLAWTAGRRKAPAPSVRGHTRPPLLPAYCMSSLVSPGQLVGSLAARPPSNCMIVCIGASRQPVGQHQAVCGPCTCGCGSLMPKNG